MNCEKNVSNGSEIEPRVDWLTATTDKEKHGLIWYGILQRYQKMIEQKTGRSVPIETNARWRQYSGVKCEGFYWGRSDRHGWIAVVSGDAAAMLWQEIAPAAKKITRLDLAVTVELHNRDVDLARASYRSANDGRDKPQYAIWESRGGKTLYVGSRQSNYYGRLYDKGGEEGKETGYKWRYEVELKDGVKNMPFTSRLYNTWRKDGPVGDMITGWVWNWFFTRGVTPIFRVEGNEQLSVSVELKVQSVDKKLDWLRTQVAPTLDKLARLGYGNESLYALGLTAEQLPFWGESQ